LVALLGLLFLSAALSTALHPSRQAALFISSLAASIAVSLVFAVTRRRAAVPILLGAATLTALICLVWVSLVNPDLVGTKSALISGHLKAWLVDHQLNVAGGIGHPNVAGVVAAMVVPGWLALSLAAHRLTTRLAWSSLLVFALAILVASGSRGGLAAATVGVAAVSILRFKQAIWLVGGLAGLCALAVIGPWGIGTTVVRMLVVGSGNDQARLPVWEASLRAILESPWTGRGIGSFPFAYSRLPGGDPVAIGTHNTFLQVWLDLGLLGLLALCGLTVLLLVNCLRAAPGNPMAQAVAGVAAAWFVISMLESTIIVGWRIGRPWEGFHEAVVPITFVLWGLSAAPFMSGKAAEPKP
jgi:O-antigen ligase